MMHQVYFLDLILSDDPAEDCSATLPPSFSTTPYYSSLLANSNLFVNTIQCTSCKFATFKKGKMHSHIFKFHSGKAKNRKLCHFCGMFITNNKHFIYEHGRVQTLCESFYLFTQPIFSPSYSCILCNIFAFNIQAISRHQKTILHKKNTAKNTQQHTMNFIPGTVKSFSCIICQEQFLLINDLKKHIYSVKHQNLVKSL